MRLPSSLARPQGNLGHRETHPLITKEGLAASHTDKLKLSFLLFDEIDKASDALWQLLLGMLDKATLKVQQGCKFTRLGGK
jgi:ATP-dependent Clp protease ATP-binding subunit ClpB